ncbi:MAG: 2OG-Fe(II) oxygenase [Pirellulales bacterium]|nr:2OG-Fe(II) oxygenase [Pirellulales bacterium]
MAKAKSTQPATVLQRKIGKLVWTAIAAQLDEQGYAVVGPLLSVRQCVELRRAFAQDAPFRKHVVMEQHGYGRGAYKYFAYPLPELVAELRAAFYPPLAELANRWNRTLGLESAYPDAHDEYLARCHAAGQQRPTPLVLRYEAGDFNCLHQDVYGDEVFPLQVAILLSEPERDFAGGEFVLTEQRPRMQSRVEVVPLRAGQGVIFPVRERPVQGTRGHYRVNMRHGVSRLRAGERYTLGIIFHDAR